MSALQMALGNTDPTMPAQTRQVLDTQQFVSDFGSASAANQRDAECSAIQFPGRAMRPADARVGCGWWFVPNPSEHSTAAYGSRRGPMNPNLDTQAGPGQWIWDPQEAYRLESMKTAANIRSCPDLQFSPDRNIGWCPSTRRAIVTDGAGNPMFPEMVGGDCPGGGIIMSASSCPPPGSASSVGGPGGGGGGGGGGVSGLCTPNNGQLTPACLRALNDTVCSPNGVMSQSLTSGYAGTSATFNTANKVLQDRGFTLPAAIVSDGRIAAQAALNAFNGVKAQARANPGTQQNMAAMNLCYGTPFDPCGISPDQTGPFDVDCITRAAIGMGFSPQGTIMPANVGPGYWAQYKTWQAVLERLRWLKAFADKGAAVGDPKWQPIAIEQVYGIFVRFPGKECNTNGMFMYRYFYPVNSDQTLMPPKGFQTSFLGRYLLKNGFPAQGSTLQDMTPAGGLLTEGQRMVARFTPIVTGTYQFLIQCDNFVRMQVDGKVIGEVGCCSVPTPTQTLQMTANQRRTLTVDLFNSGGPWSFGISISINGSMWRGIPASQLMMPEDRRKPMLELAFNKMASRPGPAESTPVADTNGIFQNLFMWNAPIGQLNGRQCLNVRGPVSGVFNYLKNSQGIRVRAMKTITMMVQINTITWSAATPSIVGFFNLPESVNSGMPRRGWTPALVQPYFKRTNDFMITASTNQVYPWGINPNISDSGPRLAPYQPGQWFHYALVWDDDFMGYTIYMNGKAEAPLRLRTAAYPPNLIMEQIRIGCDNHPEGQAWTGGIAWFRAFDYRLDDALIKRDMDDAWGAL